METDRNIPFQPFISEEDPPESDWHILEMKVGDEVQRFPIPFTDDEFAAIEVAHTAGLREDFLELVGSRSWPERAYRTIRVPWGYRLKSRQDVLSGTPVGPGIKYIAAWLGERLSEQPGEPSLHPKTREVFQAIHDSLSRFLPKSKSSE